MIQREGQFKGYPLRTYVGNNFQGGYSDHFPVYIYIGIKGFAFSRRVQGFKLSEASLKALKRG